PGQVQDLADVVGRVAQAADQGLLGRVRLAANGDGLAQVGVGQLAEGVEQGGPAALPGGEQAGLGVVRAQDELGIPVAGRLVAVSGQEIVPAGPQVPGQVLDDQGDRVD